jgi:hypothetical protein
MAWKPAKKPTKNPIDNWVKPVEDLSKINSKKHKKS